MLLDDWVMEKLNQLKEVYQEYINQSQHQKKIPSDQCLLAMALDDKIEFIQSLIEQIRSTGL